jgi:hypothetical protein
MAPRAPGQPTGIHRRARQGFLVLVLAPAILVAGCGRLQAQPSDVAPWKGGGSVEEVTASADGPLAVACPTLARAQAAVPGLAAGPEVNTTPFKTMVLQCGWSFAEPDAQLRPAGIGILVFDASAEGVHLWDSVRADPSFGNSEDIPGLGEVGFATGAPGHQDVWVVQGSYGFHMSHTRQAGVPLAQLAGLARAMLAGLASVKG